MSAMGQIRPSEARPSTAGLPPKAERLSLAEWLHSAHAGTSGFTSVQKPLRSARWPKDRSTAP